MSHYLYRVQIVEYPEGALLRDEFDGDYSYPDPSWRPEGWAPDREYLDRFGTKDFIWPTARKEWKSRSSAMKRKQLIESYGAKAIVQRSSEITWPEDGYERIDDALLAQLKTVRHPGGAA